MPNQQQLHINPTQLGAPEKLIWGLTARQLFMLALGGSIGYRLWGHFAFLLAYGIAGFGTRLLLACIPVLLAFALALIQLGGRSLEIWAILLLRYWGKQKQAVWWSVHVKDKYALDLTAELQAVGSEKAAGEENE